MANRDTATFDLLVTVWERQTTLFVFIAVALLLGIGASFLLPAQQRATATLVPLSEGQAARLFPVTVPESIAKGGNEAFAPDAGQLFDRFLVALSGEASSGVGRSAASEEDVPDYRLNQVDKEGRRFAELTVSASAGERASEGLQAWIDKSEQVALRDLSAEFSSLVSQRLGDAEYLLNQKLAQEDYQLLAREQRLQDELKLVSALLENDSVDIAIPDSFLLFPQKSENLFDDGLPPYLLSRDLLQARAAQLRLQLEQLAKGAGDGAYLPEIAGLKAQQAALSALKAMFESWAAERQDRSLVRFSAFPTKEEASGLKRSVLFGAGGVMLGLLLGLVWVFLAEAVRLARGRSV